MIGIKKSISVVFSTLAMELSRLIKFSFMQGSNALFFSSINIAAPMIGVIGGLNLAISSFVFQVILKYTFLGFSFIPLIGYHIPHFFAAGYWNSNLRVVKFLIPAMCMSLFLMHPQTSIAYAMLWLIPMAIALFNKENIFLKALGSTFVAHAVGSVIWIYFVPMSQAQWVILIPVVLVERFLFAAGMFALFHAFNLIKSYSSKTALSLRVKEILRIKVFSKLLQKSI